METVKEYRLPVRRGGPRVAAIGGGTGLSTMLRGLKRYTDQITAVVTVADDGGGSGVLRQELGMLPPGDIRNCMEALANAEPLMRQLMHYREFLREGGEIWFKTDDEELYRESLDYFADCGFALRYQTTDLHKEEPDWNLRTEYEEKFAALGVPIKALIAVKQPGQP